MKKIFILSFLFVLVSCNNEKIKDESLTNTWTNVKIESSSWALTGSWQNDKELEKELQQDLDEILNLLNE